MAAERVSERNMAAMIIIISYYSSDINPEISESGTATYADFIIIPPRDGPGLAAIEHSSKNRYQAYFYFLMLITGLLLCMHLSTCRSTGKTTMNHNPCPGIIMDTLGPGMLCSTVHSCQGVVKNRYFLRLPDSCTSIHKICGKFWHSIGYHGSKANFPCILGEILNL